MHTSNATRRLVLLAILVGTLGWLFLLTNREFSLLLAAESPLPQPWPTLVVDYPPALPEVAAPASQASAVRVSWLFRSPLALPTLPPDALAPSTTLTVTGELGQDGWLRSPATLTLAITDNVGAGVSEVRLAGLAEWTEREYLSATRGA